MRNIKVVNSVVVGFVVIFLAAAGLSGDFGLLTGSAASGPKEIAGDQVPDGLSPSDWDGIRAAYEAGRSSSIGSIGQEAFLKPGAVGTTQAGELYGTSVAVAGDTVVVGAPLEDSSTTGVNNPPNESAQDSGAAYVFIRSAGVWTQQAFLKPAAVGTSQAGDNFGVSVAVAGDTVVVGANREDSGTIGVNSTPNEGGAPDSGAAYVFTRSAGVWTQQAYLKPAAVGATQAGDYFGWSVAVAGDTVVIAAPLEDSSTTVVNSTPNESANGSGAAYVFTRSDGVWTQQANLKPAAVGTTQEGDQFGFSVAVAGDTVVVGAFLEDSSTTVVNSTPNESALESGAAYVFTRSAGVWTQQAYLKPAAVGTTQASDNFGRSVAVSGDTVVVGAPLEDSGTTGVNSTPNEGGAFQSGAAYVFTRIAGMWTQQAYIKPAAFGTTQEGDQFGFFVAVSGDTMVVGANFEDSNMTGVTCTPDESAPASGTAYVLTRSAGVWTQNAYLKPAAFGTTQMGDQFGFSVAVSGNTVVVGAIREDTGTTGVNSPPDESAQSSGAAYVYLSSPPQTQRPLFDFDGDGKADLTVWRPSDGTWYTLQSSDGAFHSVEWGQNGDLPAPGDFDGNGRTDYTVFRPSNGVWWTRFNPVLNPSTTQFGISSDLPIPGDYDGDGIDDIAVWRSGVWYLQLTIGESSAFQWGLSGDRPLSGDFDGDGRTDFAIYRDGEWWITNSGDGSITGINFGLSSDRPVPADYDGDGKTDIAVFRPSDGVWYYLRSCSCSSFAFVQWGISTDVPAPADYDGDGTADFAVYRGGDWHILRSSDGTSLGVHHGAAGDIPIPAAKQF